MTNRRSQVDSFAFVDPRQLSFRTESTKRDRSRNKRDLSWFATRNSIKIGKKLIKFVQKWQKYQKIANFIEKLFNSRPIGEWGWPELKNGVKIDDFIPKIGKILELTPRLGLQSRRIFHYSGSGQTGKNWFRTPNPGAFSTTRGSKIGNSVNTPPWYPYRDKPNWRGVFSIAIPALFPLLGAPDCNFSSFLTPNPGSGHPPNLGSEIGGVGDRGPKSGFSAKKTRKNRKMGCSNAPQKMPILGSERVLAVFPGDDPEIAFFGIFCHFLTQKWTKSGGGPKLADPPKFVIFGPKNDIFRHFWPLFQSNPGAFSTTRGPKTDPWPGWGTE